MAVKVIKLTRAGLKSREEELNYLKGHMRMEVAERIKEAISFGDISENAEYDDAKNEQAHLESRIVQLEQTLSKATIIDEDEMNLEEVNLGLKVIVLDLELKEEVEYYIVGSAESDPFQNKISDESPVGSKLLGKKVGDIVDVATPDGTMQFKILNIHR